MKNANLLNLCNAGYVDVPFSQDLIDVLFFQERPDTQRLNTLELRFGTPEPSFGGFEDLHQHLEMLAREFSDAPLLDFYHAGLTVMLRRKMDPQKNWEIYQKLWEDYGMDLKKRLNSRWLVSACDTFADYSENEAERMAALAGSLFMNTLKLYETERVVSGETGKKLAPVDSLIPLDLDGMTAFMVGSGNMIFNLLERLKQPFSDQLVPYGILLELIDRAQLSDTVYRRFLEVHTDENTKWG